MGGRDSWKEWKTGSGTKQLPTKLLMILKYRRDVDGILHVVIAACVSLHLT